MCNNTETSVGPGAGRFPSRVIQGVNTDESSLFDKKPKMARKAHPKSFEDRFLRVSSLFNRIAIGCHGIMPPKSLILLEGGGGVVLASE